MAHPFHHAQSSARRFGGKTADYLELHRWFDASKQFYAHWRHRALRHHAEGIFLAETIFGITITNSEGKKVPTRLIAEQHVREDLGFIPSMQDWFQHLRHQPWMTRGVQKIEIPEDHEYEKGSSAAQTSDGTAADRRAETDQPERQDLSVS